MSCKREIRWSLAVGRLAFCAGVFVVGATIALPTRALAASKTERLWKAKCATCHGVDGKGGTETGKDMGIGDMTSVAFQKDLTLEKIKKQMSDGMKREKNGKQQEMQSFKDVLNPEEMDALAAYVKAFGPK